MSTSIDSAINSVVAAKQTSLASQIATAVASKNIQVSKQQGAAAVELIEDVAQLVKETGKGHGIDSHA